MGMITFRSRIADGTASPSEVAAFEQTQHRRQAAMDDAVAGAVDELIASRTRSSCWRRCGRRCIRSRKACARRDSPARTSKTIRPCLSAADSRGRCCRTTTGSSSSRRSTFARSLVYHLYTMQELNTPFPKCQQGATTCRRGSSRSRSTSTARSCSDTDGAQIQCRAAFFDLSLDGRWGGVISGDKSRLDFSPCACGHHGPAIGHESSATPTSRATTRSAARAPSTPT